MSPHPADSGLIDVACPACGEIYHLRPDSVGKRMECANRICRRRFVVELPASDAAIGNKSDQPQTPEVLVAQPVVDAATDDEPPVQIAGPPRSVGVSPAPPKAGGTPAPQPAGTTAIQAGGTPTLRSAEAETSAPPTPQNNRQSPGRTKRRRGQPRWVVRLEIISAATLAVLAIYVGVLQFQEWSRTPAEEWKKAQALYQDHKWEHARTALSKFAERFPEAPETATVPFFLELCAAGDEVYSPTGDLTRGMAALERLFRAHRDSPAYHEYAGDLFQALGRLVERSIDRARQLSERTELEQAKKSADDLARARQAHELLQTVAETMHDAWVPDRVEQFRQTIDERARSVKLNLTRTEIVANFRRVPGFPIEDDLAAVYTRIEGLLHDEPELAADPLVLKEQTLAHRSEAARVRYHSQADGDDDSEAPPPAVEKTLAVVWKTSDDARAQAPTDGDDTTAVVALAQGVLYAFDTAGRPLWARRVGLDVDRLPVRASVSAAGGEVLIVRSSTEQALLALDSATGSERWRFAAPGAISAPLTLVTVAGSRGGPPLLRGLLPTADGRIYVLEPVLGKRLGYYETGWPLTVGGAFDPVTGRLFFAADFDRVLAIDPAAIEDAARPPCSSVLFSKHASGSLRSEPRVVGPYLVLIEGADLDRSRLRAWTISEGGFADTDAAPLAEQSVAGWSWFAPQASPDRLLFATDQGELGLFGVNLDNPSEAAYRLIEDSSQPPSTRLPDINGERALLAYAQNQSLWVQAGSSLRRLAIDVLGQRMKTVWSVDEAAAQTQIPLHEAQVRDIGGRTTLYLCTMTADANRFELAAREADSGAAIWSRQLGLRPVGDPIMDDGRVLMADRSGRIAAFALGVEPPDATMLIEPDDGAPLAGVAGEPLLIDDGSGHAWLFARLVGTTDVAVRPLAPQSAWHRLQSPGELLGTPCMLNGSLVAACSDGLVHRLTASASAGVNEQPFVWFVGERPPQATISLTSVGHETVLICDGQMIERLQYQVRDSVGQWLRLGDRYTSNERIVGRPIVHGEHIFVAKASGVVEVLDAYGPSQVRHRWQLKGVPTSELFVRAGHVLLVVDDRRLVSLTAAAGDFDEEPSWMCAAVTGAICGLPSAYGDSLIVADSAGTILALDLADGQKTWETSLGPGQAPAAAPAIVGDRLLLVPLIDGTLTLTPMPAPDAERSEQSQ